MKIRFNDTGKLQKTLADLRVKRSNIKKSNDLGVNSDQIRERVELSIPDDANYWDAVKYLRSEAYNYSARNTLLKQ